MMHKDLMRGVAKTIIDGLKDAQMQCDYAKRAKEEGNEALSMLHKQEAEMRLKGVREWYEKAKQMGLIPEEMHPAEEVLIEHHKGWYHSLKERMEQ